MRPPVHARVKRKKGSGRKKEEARKKERVSGKRVKEGSEHASGQRPCELHATLASQVTDFAQEGDFA